MKIELDDRELNALANAIAKNIVKGVDVSSILSSLIGGGLK